MTTLECAGFLQQSLPRLGLRWAGFRKVRRLVCKRMSRRIAELGLANLASYREYLAQHDGEWDKLDEMCRIPISRFYRDRAVFEALEHDVLPALATQAIAAGRHELRCWSACCASGEEAHTLAILWHTRLGPLFASLALRIIATDVDPRVLNRAQVGWYSISSMKELPESLLCAGFERSGSEYRVREMFRTVEFAQQDIRRTDPGGWFDIILCRNAVLTYLMPRGQEEVMTRIISRLRPGGALVIGVHESLPRSCTGLKPWPGTRAVYRALAPPELAPVDSHMDLRARVPAQSSP
jgi:chemotaxis protein methyltransferase CheR